MNKLKISLIFVLTLLLFSACFKYSFKGALPSNIKTIYIPMFFDESGAGPVTEAAELLYQDVINKFIEDNTLQLVNKEKDADLVLTGTINRIYTMASSVQENETVQENRLSVSMNLECLNKHTDKPLWKGSLSHYSEYNLDSGDIQETYLEVVELLANDILDKTIAAW